MIERASLFSYYPDCSLFTCSAEDLIVLKAFSGRAKDWMDVEGIVVRQRQKLDTDYIIEQLMPFCEVKEAPEVVDKLKSLLSHT